MSSTTATIPQTHVHSREYDGAVRPASRPAASAVSWGAIAAGAATAASLSLLLVMLGMGLGLSAVSPWSTEGISATSFGVSTIVWLTLTQLIASAMGGYIAGRLRTRWMDVPSDEVYFRDTAHGFLAWAVAVLISASVLTSTFGSILGGGVQAGASIAGGVASGAATVATGAAASSKSMNGSGPLDYFVDSLFRPGQASAMSPTMLTAENRDSTSARSAAEVSRIFVHASRTDPLPPADVRYVGQLVAERTGLTQQDAERRVTDTYATFQGNLREAEVATKTAADAARKAVAYGTLWLFLSLLIGAFVASLSATFGGHMRDD